MFSLRMLSLKQCSTMAGALLAILVLAPKASADPVIVRINFSGVYASGPDAGSSFSGFADLTLGTDPKASANYPSPSPPPFPGGPGGPLPTGSMPFPTGTTRFDPQGAQMVTAASGMFNGVAITGVRPIGAQVEPSAHEYVPASLTRLAATGSDGVTYDNLFYSGGSPLTCLWYFGTDSDGNIITHAKYPFAGGFLDPYGLLFTLDGGSLLNLWSNGHGIPGTGPGPLNYGVTLIMQQEDGTFAEYDGIFSGATASVPAPGFVWLFGATLVGVFGWRRWRESREVGMAG